MSKDITVNIHKQPTKKLYEYIHNYFMDLFTNKGVMLGYTENLTHVLTEIVLRNADINTSMVPIVFHYDKTIYRNDLDGYLSFENNMFNLHLAKKYFKITEGKDLYWDDITELLFGMYSVCHETRHVVQNVYVDSYAEYMNRKKNKKLLKTHPELYYSQTKYAIQDGKCVIPKEYSEDCQSMLILINDFNKVLSSIKLAKTDIKAFAPYNSYISKAIRKRCKTYENAVRFLHPTEQDADLTGFETMQNILSKVIEIHLEKNNNEEDKFVENLYECKNIYRDMLKLRRKQWYEAKTDLNKHPKIELKDIKESVKSYY